MATRGRWLTAHAVGPWANSSRILCRQLSQLYDNKAVRIHLLGHSIARPYAAPQNPLAAWAEKQKEAAEKAAAEEESKKAE